MLPGGQAKVQKFFTGPVRLASVDDLDAFVRRAKPDESFVWCEAPEQIRGETSVRVTELVRDGLVRHHHVRRQGGGWEFTVFRTAKTIERRKSPQEAALADPATETIFRHLKRAANLGLACPSDAELARRTGLSTRAQAQCRVRKLIEVGLIESTLAYEGGVPFRVVAILATGKTTALPGKWRALQEAARADVAGGSK